HQVLGERFRRFDSGGFRARSKGGDAVGREMVNQSGCEWSLRADDDQIDVVLANSVLQCVVISYVGRQVGCDECGTAAARSAEDSGRAGEEQEECVLPPPAPNDQDPHLWLVPLKA